MKAAELNEETRALLKRIVEANAYRELMLANIRGRALSFVWELEEKIELARELTGGLERLRAVRSLYRELRHGSVVSAIRAKMERIPYPATRLELGVCLHLCELAIRLAAETYAQSVCDELAAIAAERRSAGTAEGGDGDSLFVEYCAEPQHRPQAQQYFDRWLAICLSSLGRPGTKGDERAVALGLRRRSCEAIASEFLERLEPLRGRCGLEVSGGGALGVVLPPAFRA